MPAPELPALPTPCTPGQTFTLKFLCNGEGNGGTLFWFADPGTVGPMGMTTILDKAIDKGWKPADVHKLAESMKPTPCKCGQQG